MTRKYCDREHYFNGVTYRCEQDAGHYGYHGATYHGEEWITWPRESWETVKQRAERDAPTGGENG